MSIGGISSVAMTAPISASIGGAPSSPATAQMTPASAGRMDQLIQLMQGFSSPEILMAMLQSASQAPQHHHASAHGGIADAICLTIGQQMTGSMGGFAAMSAAPSVGASISVQA